MKLHKGYFLRPEGGVGRCEGMGGINEWTYRRSTNKLFCCFCHVEYSADWWDRLMVWLGLIPEEKEGKTNG